MMPAFPGRAAPAAGFEVPLEMLATCQLRVQAQCETLPRPRPPLAALGSDRAAYEVAAAVKRCFDGSTRHHPEDEEIEPFPALTAGATGGGDQRGQAPVEDSN